MLFATFIFSCCGFVAMEEASHAAGLLCCGFVARKKASHSAGPVCCGFVARKEASHAAGLVCWGLVAGEEAGWLRQQNRSALLWFCGLPLSLPQNHNRQDQPRGFPRCALCTSYPLLSTAHRYNESTNCQSRIEILHASSSTNQIMWRAQASGC